ncbi:serine protease SPPA, chloroplastic [Olea europaea subsp. europaea]|uniref:Serine protease SPPA, chloroplastic n=1 Tax=Olea europaea subsp. europaea TaxID=158383 RepID=A0A8S0S1C4_OLEEU|nr:serine protease SPPA, chloroplastic [Olea europaea subsp. europaea]
MSVLLSTPRSSMIHIYTCSSIISRPFSIQHRISRFSPTLEPQFLLKNVLKFRRYSTRAFDVDNNEVVADKDGKIEVGTQLGDSNDDGSIGVYNDEKYPSGEFVFRKYDLWESFTVKLKMLFAFPWERVKKGSVLTMRIRGEISDQLKSRFSSRLSLPQICENFIKAAYDPRIVGIYLHIEPLSCGWGKVEEIRRHILNFKKSGKFIVGYVPACGEKEYYIGSACEELYAPPSAYFQLYGLTVSASFIGGVLEKVGVEPQIQRIGKYKSAGDQLARKTISDENREMLTALLDNIYENWLDKISLAKGKKKEDIENFVNEGVYEVGRLKENCWLTDIKYDDEIISLLKERLGLPSIKTLPTVDYRYLLSNFVSIIRSNTWMRVMRLLFFLRCYRTLCQDFNSDTLVHIESIK